MGRHGLAASLIAALATAAAATPARAETLPQSTQDPLFRQAVDY